MLFFSQLVNGLQLGAIYALIALGYSMVYGIIRLLNFAHGDVIMVGGYIAPSCNPLTNCEKNSIGKSPLRTFSIYPRTLLHRL